MNKDVVLSRAGEQLEECIILYSGMSGGVDRAYFDKECTRCLTADEMKDAYLKRCVVFVEARSLMILQPYHCRYYNDFGYATLTVSDTNPVTLYSAEYVKS